jgi:hypothetical protein
MSDELKGIVAETLTRDDVHAAFDELVLMPDHGAIDVACAGVVANYADGDSVNPLLVGASGCGKSEIIRALFDVENVHPLSTLTPNTLLSGFDRNRNHDDDHMSASLLLQIGKFGILAFKDLTTVLTMGREARSEIIGQLREVADGHASKQFGTGEWVTWEGKLGLVAGVTPIIDEQHSFLAVMGERFALYRVPQVPRRALARRALAKRGLEPKLRENIRKTVAGFLGQFRDCGPLDFPDKFNEPLIELADVVTRARSGVARGGYSRELLYLPDPEAPTRFAKQIAQLGAALLRIGVSEAEMWRLVRKIGWDSVPAVRCFVLDVLTRNDEAATKAMLTEETGLPKSTVDRVAEDLTVLGLVDRHKNDAGHWQYAAAEDAYVYRSNSGYPEKLDPPHGVAEGSLQGGSDISGKQHSSTGFEDSPGLDASPNGHLDCPVCNTPKLVAKVVGGVVYGQCGHILADLASAPADAGGWD